jgi:hypothetical protein
MRRHFFLPIRFLKASITGFILVCTKEKILSYNLAVDGTVLIVIDEVICLKPRALLSKSLGYIAFLI